MLEKTCCITGHRDIPEDKRAYVEAELRREVREAIADGYTYFLSGFAAGTDLIFAAIVAEEQQRTSGLFLEAAIPCPERLKSPDAEFQKLIAVCNGIKVVCEKYTPNCYLSRNCYMVSQSSRVLAVYDGRVKGGTLATMRYAHSLGREVRLIEI